MKILYAAYLNYGSTSYSRMLALRDLGYDLIELDYHSYFKGSGIINKLQHKFLEGPSVSKINSDLLKLDELHNPDIVWIDKGLFIKPGTVKKLKERKRFLVQHNTDDIKKKSHGFQKNVLPVVGLFDVHITSNTFNLSDFKEFGAKNVIHMELAYNHHLHKPVELGKDEYEKYKADVSFMGHWEDETEKYIVGLRDIGIKVRLFGTGWKNAKDAELRNSVIPGVFGDEYVKALCASKINLCFLSVWNRNVTSARTFEIPACRTFMLAVRNPVHQGYFEEGKEAEFFSDINELENKIKYYLEHEDERKRIAEAGYQRCISSGYSDFYRMKEVMNQVLEIYNK
jgi:spore maturation protein CgeB